MCVCVCVCVFRCVQLLVTLWIVAHQAPMSMELSRPEYWSGFLRNLHAQQSKPTSLALAGRFFSIAIRYMKQSWLHHPSSWVGIAQLERVFLAGKGRAAWVTSFSSAFWALHKSCTSVSSHSKTEMCRWLKTRKKSGGCINPSTRKRLRFLVTLVTFAIDFVNDQ